MFFGACDTAYLPAPEPGCQQPRSQGQMFTPGQQDGILAAQDPSLSQKAVVLHQEDGRLLHHQPKGSPCTP